jgi:hypothetical protein
MYPTPARATIGRAGLSVPSIHCAGKTLAPSLVARRVLLMSNPSDNSPERMHPACDPRAHDFVIGRLFGFTTKSGNVSSSIREEKKMGFVQEDAGFQWTDGYLE